MALVVSRDEVSEVARGYRYPPGTVNSVPERGDRLRLKLCLPNRIVSSPGGDSKKSELVEYFVPCHIYSLARLCVVVKIPEVYAS
jgi:hypothetical protein